MVMLISTKGQYTQPITPMQHKLNCRIATILTKHPRPKFCNSLNLRRFITNVGKKITRNPLTLSANPLRYPSSPLRCESKRRLERRNEQPGLAWADQSEVLTTAGVISPSGSITPASGVGTTGVPRRLFDNSVDREIRDRSEVSVLWTLEGSRRGPCSGSRTVASAARRDVGRSARRGIDTFDVAATSQQSSTHRGAKRRELSGSLPLAHFEGFDPGSE